MAAGAASAAAAGAAGVGVGAPPDQFVVYHYNGIGARLCRLSVLQVDQMMVEPDLGSEDARGLKQVLQTRWPNALIEYLGDEPKLD